MFDSFTEFYKYPLPKTQIYPPGGSKQKHTSSLPWLWTKGVRSGMNYN